MYMVRLGFCVVVLICCFASTKGVPLQDANHEEHNLSQHMVRCAETGGLLGILNCATERTIRTIRKASMTNDFEVLPGITLYGETNKRLAKELKEDSLPVDPKQRASKLMTILLNTALEFISGRTLRVKFPEDTNSIARAFEEGRGKMKKMMGPLMLGLGAKMMGMIPIMMGGLGLLASKALITAKLAFILAVVLFVQFFFFNRQTNMTPFSTYGAPSSYGPPAAYGSNQIGGYPYARSIDVSSEAVDESVSSQDIVYARQKPM